VPENKFPDAKGEYWAHCPLPDHATERRPDNFSVSLKGYKCFSCGGKGSLKVLARILGIEYQPPRRGCTLEEYAKLKRLPPGFLRGLGLQDGDWFGRPALDIPYKDESGRLIRLRKRIALQKDKRSRKDNRFRWDKGNAQPLYGLWRLAEIERAGWVLLLEGESDCHTAWLHQIPALGVPGAANWDKAKGNLLPRLRALKVYVWREPDQGGDTFIQAIQRDLPEARIIRPPEGTKDLSEAHCRGEDVAALLEELKARAEPIGSVRPLRETAETLAGFAPWIREQLGERNDRDIKLAIAEALAGWLLSHKRLIVDDGHDPAKGGRAYLASDNGALWPLEKDAVPTRLVLYEAGLNGTEAVYFFVVEAITMEAHRAGQHLTLSRWQARRGDNLYVSCGPTAMVRCREERLERLPNGTDGVWFAADAAYPEWRITEPVEPRTLAAFRPNIVTPDEVPDYTPDWQAELITAWLACLLSGLRPLPLLVPIGMNGGGKTTLVKAVLRTLMGPDTDITGVPDSVRDLQTQITTAPMVGLDNVDKEVPPWFGDELAAGLTGKAIEMRQLYTNAVKLSRPVTAALAVTTRTGAFFRPDIAQRALPVLTDEFTDPDRVADEELLGEVDARRDGLLSWCALTAARLLAERRNAPPGLPLRFVDFARMVWAYQHLQGRPTQAAHMLLALRKAQALTVGEADPLVEAIAVWFHEIAFGGHWEGTPAELVKALSTAGAELPVLGGGKRIARQLREARKTLELMGVVLTESKSGNQTLFALDRRSTSLVMSTEKPENPEIVYKPVLLHQGESEADVRIGLSEHSPDSPDSPSDTPSSTEQAEDEDDDEEPDEGPWYIN
jgi:hypothetical protein